jgi:hypothetical protein
LPVDHFRAVCDANAHQAVSPLTCACRAIFRASAAIEHANPVPIRLPDSAEAPRHVSLPETFLPARITPLSTPVMPFRPMDHA